MTPTQEVIELIRPRLLAAINAADLGWVERKVAGNLGPKLALWELEIALSLVNPAAAAAIMATLQAALPYLCPATIAIAQLLLRLLSQPRSTFSTEVQVSAPSFAPVPSLVTTP